jgi:methionine synthase II (cobalamin-independent)
VTAPPRVLWSTGAATGIGSLPGEDAREASELVLGELPVPHLPELPGRGWHADLAGRGAALLADLYVDVQPTGWRIVPRPSRDGRRAKDLLARDLDAFEAAAHGSPPEVLKLQATGPWTLATLLELHRGDRVLADHGAVKDLAQSLAEGLRRHLADVHGRFPSTTLALQLDEPSLPAVLQAGVPTSSGFATLRAPTPQTAREHLRTVLEVTEHTVVHCCAPRPPVDLLVSAGAAALSLDAAMLDARDDDDLGAALEQGTGLLLGVLPATGSTVTDVRTVLRTVGRLRDRVGVQQVALTPACGLAGATPAYARAAMKRLAEAAGELAGVLAGEEER